ncbi:KR, adh short, and/or PP-binding domain containing protein [Asbolus verrucosus]|uniref:KR, adh short, and/or PP-binding domain containing protein n=1 Tax=Asbolus verrucosus TaxID=1661398 RepID=A0A482WBM9_ASBVE|nr:KR, adh short, and/or PP-binding domain containing protein [Asbolus verrucosus]
MLFSKTKQKRIFELRQHLTLSRRCIWTRYFVVFSSLACGGGNSSQTNYGVANSFMERICEKRKRDGFPALAIQWGAIGEVGLVAKIEKENRELVLGGILQQKVFSCLEVSDKFLNQKHSIVASMIVAKKCNKNYGESAVEAVAYISNLIELGMDSITSTEILQLLEKYFNIYLTLKEVKSLTFAKITEVEVSKKGKLKLNDNKTDKVSSMVLKFLPETSNLPLIKLSSRVGDDDETATVFVLPGVEGAMIPLQSLISSLKAHVFGVHYSYHKPEDSIVETAKTILPEKFLKCNSYQEHIDLATSLLSSNVTTKKLDKQGVLVLYKRYKSISDYSFAHEKLKFAVRLFKAKIPLVTNIRVDYEPSQFFEQPVEVTLVEGDHVTLLDETKLAEAVNLIVLQ